MKPLTRPLLLITSALTAALVAACGGGGGAAPSSTGADSVPDAQANKVTNATLPVSASVTPVSAVIGDPGWVSALPGPLRQRSTAPTASVVAGTAYHVDIVTGNDNNPGTIEAPWRTLTKASNAPLKPGDALLLKCGSIWRDSLEITSVTAPNGGFVVGGYGDCSGDRRPIIRASDWVPTDKWVRASETDQPIYKRTWSGAPIKHLFSNGAPMLVARYPNFKSIGEEFALASSNTSTKSFKVRPEDLQVFAGKDLIGAVIHVRTLQWLFDTAKVAAFDPATGIITLDRALSTSIREGAGYVLEGKRWMLDAPNEWYFDNDTQEMHVWAPGGANPASGAGLEAATRDYGLTIKWVSGVRVERIRTEQQAEDGIRLIETPDSTISDVAVVHPYQLGISVVTSPRVTVRDSVVHGAGRRGIVNRDSVSARILSNQVTDTGGFGRADDTEQAISVYGQDSIVSGNYVARSGSVGIFFQNAPGVVIENNSIYQPCLRLSDCAGIHTWTATSSAAAATSYTARAMVRNNIIVKSFSNTEGCGLACDNLGTGIYLDEMTSGVTLLGNTISDVEIGIALHNAHFNKIDSNVVRNATFASIRAIQSRSTAAVFTGNEFVNNSLVAERNMTLTNGLPSDQRRVHAFYWFHPSNPKSMYVEGVNLVSGNKVMTTQADGEATWGLATWTSSALLTAKEWKQAAKTDTTVSRTVYRPLVATTETNLIPNSMFDPALGAWSTYFNPAASGGSFSMGKFAACGNNNCGRHLAASTGDQLLSGLFQMNPNSGQNLHVFRVTATGGTVDSIRTAAIRRLVSPWDNYGLAVKVINVPAGKTVEFEQFFLAKNGDAGVLDLRGPVGDASYTRSATVSRVSKIEFQDRSRLMTNVINPTANPLSFPCVALKLSTCDALDELGNRVNWPLVVPARSSLLVYAQDKKWKQ